MVVKRVDIELTTKCNLSCKYCCRTKYGTNINELDFDVLRSALDPVIDELENVLLCGSFGDVIFYPRLFDLLDYLGNSTEVLVVTNASVRDESFWSRLASYKSVSVVFPLDGLEGVHEKYRQGKFVDVVNNMTTYIDNGGNATAQMLLFRHNEHQVDDVKKLVENMGGSIYYRVSRQYDNEFKRPIKYPIKTLHEMTEEKDNVYCQFIHENFIYITAKGEVMPCCHYHPGRFRIFGNDETLSDKRFMSNLSIYKTSIKDALKSSLFSYIIENKDSLPVCRNVCRIRRTDKMFEEIPCQNM